MPALSARAPPDTLPDQQQAFLFESRGGEAGLEKGVVVQENHEGEQVRISRKKKQRWRELRQVSIAFMYSPKSPRVT